MGLILGTGNCQVEGIIRCAASALGMQPEFVHPTKITADPNLWRDKLAGASMVFATRGSIHKRAARVARDVNRADLPVIATPIFHFSGFHPDATWPGSTGKRKGLPLGDANSAILLAAWRDGIGEAGAISLFREEVYAELGYFDMFALSEQALIEECAGTGFDATSLIRAWLKQGPFAYMPLHPTIDVLRDFATALLESAGICDKAGIDGVEDKLARRGLWPIFPEIGRRIGIRGDYVFRPKNTADIARADLAPMSLETFIQRTYSCWRTTPPELGAFQRLADERLTNIARFIGRPRPLHSANPYVALSAEHWWSKAVAKPDYHEIDPVKEAKFKISKSDRVATAGSCFAQHISRRLQIAGFNYMVTEAPPADCPDPAAADYGVFTARFGNVQTVRQLLQLADRAYGEFEPAMDAWPAPKGFVDPFRPRIGGRPFPSLNALRESRQEHFIAVRKMFEECDVFVFTLGLTEAWRSRVDGAVVPLPPGVVGAKEIASDYEPVNFKVAEVIEDLRSLMEMFNRRNPQARVLLTVSPVPLIATHQDQHVLQATTYSKSALRVAAGEIAAAYDNAAYFPSYEIITGSFNRGRYFADDLRQVTDEGVEHVMRLFLRHFAGVGQVGLTEQSNPERFSTELRTAMDIICDEEQIAR